MSINPLESKSPTIQGFEKIFEDLKLDPKTTPQVVKDSIKSHREVVDGIEVHGSPNNLHKSIFSKMKK